MKGVICYYSATGNTKLACRYITGRLGVSFDLLDVVEPRATDLGSYDVVGFATSTDFWGLPQAFQAFIEGLPEQKGKPAFVLNTFGAISGKTLALLEKAVTSKGFHVLAGHSLRMPENYPPMISRGMGAQTAPSQKRLGRFDAFISSLAGLLERVARGEKIEAKGVGVGFWNNIFRTKPRTSARKDMGEKFVEESLCTECGICRNSCPYEAIVLQPKPLFDMTRCYGCWRCYNRCPAHAIYTKKYRKGPYYPGPNRQLKEKLTSTPPQ
jgi:ferredoxin/flavodoxin